MQVEIVFSTGRGVALLIKEHIDATEKRIFASNKRQRPFKGAFVDDRKCST